MTAAGAALSTPIAGVTPAQTRETTVMTVWPSISMYGIGRFLGQLFEIRWPDVYIFRLGHLFALASIPVALGLYFLRVLPFVGQRYTLTNRRVVVYRGLLIAEDKAVDLDGFDAIDVVVQPGQAWFDAGDLIFKQKNIEKFRLDAVSYPEAFRATCLKAHAVCKGVKAAAKR